MAVILLLSLNACTSQIPNAKTESVKMATLTYDTTKTNQDEILQRVAMSGYDSDKFFASDEAYAKLPKCCQYDRAKKTEVVPTELMGESAEQPRDVTMQQPTDAKQGVKQLNAVFDNYFTLKDALVNSDGNLASAKAKNLLDALNAVQMNKLPNEEHTVWMKVNKDLVFDTEHMEETKDAGHQRDHFNTLSDNIYQLLKV